MDAVNKGLRRAKGEILSIQSSDDVFLDGAVEAAVEALSHDPTIGLVYGDVELIDEEYARDGGGYSGPFRSCDVFRPHDVCAATGDIFYA